MFTTGFATKNNQSNTVFLTGAGARSFELPQDCSFVTISACGGGGAGANGATGTTAQVKWGGGGGSSGSISVAMWPRFFLPDTIYITIGAGGINGGAAASNTVVGVQAGSTTSGLLVTGLAGTAATAGTTANPGLGGTAVTKPGWGNAFGYYYFGFGQTQYAGRQGNQGDLNSNSPTQTFYSPDQIYSIVSPGLGGGTTNSSTLSVKSGNATYLLDFANTTAQQHGGGSAGGVSDGYAILNNSSPLYFAPATGGYSARTSAGFLGGKGAPGCGGAGGGGGTTGGVGGNGGDGWVLINYW
jgi:hypothetical protein